MSRRSVIINQLANLSRDGWAHAQPCDYQPLERELMSLTMEQWRVEALRLVAAAERDLGRLSAGQRRDLLKDRLDIGSALVAELVDQMEAAEDILACARGEF